jgi:hypothetical protein
MDKLTIQGLILSVALFNVACGDSRQQPQASLTTEFSLEGPHWTDLDPAVQAEFTYAHQQAEANDRPVFKQYLPEIGPVALLDYLEATYPACHGQAHSLGKELYKQSQDLMVSLQICGTRCTGACMHGVVGEALGEGGGMHQDIRGRMEGFCDSEAMSAHKRGNCAHAIGHALLLNSRDLNYALEGCDGYELPAMRYYCATGVYMQYRDWLREGEIPDDRPSTLFPCDEQKLYPAACYRYMMSFIQNDSDLQGQEIIAICLKLETQQERLGCFHGFGAAYRRGVMNRLDAEPDVLDQLCVHGTIADQTMCVEGVIDKITDVDADMARRACDGLTGEIKQICYDAARDGMYSLDKPTMSYYLMAEPADLSRTE